ncbi:MAG: recombinase family protein [Thermodesulfobacteriota bacterium]|nr:recombinase family protein [Thermodesulfobacteriota bacterium]
MQGAKSLKEIAAMLNANNYRTARGGKWHANSVSRIVKRAA